MSDPSIEFLIAESDQLAAYTRDLLKGLGLHAVASWSPSEEFLQSESAERLDRRLALEALNAMKNGHAFLLVAIPTAEGGAIRHFIEAATDDGPPAGWTPTVGD